MLDRLKFLVKRCSKIFLLVNHFDFTKICKGVKAAKKNKWLKLNNFGFKFQQVHLVLNHCLLWRFFANDRINTTNVD